MGSRSRSENHLVQHSVGNSESTRSSSTNHLFEERRGWDRGSGTQKFVDQKRPKAILPFENFMFSHYEIWVQRGGRVSSDGCQLWGEHRSTDASIKLWQRNLPDLPLEPSTKSCVRQNIGSRPEAFKRRVVANFRTRCPL